VGKSLGFARQLKWLGEVVPLKIAKFLSCLDSLDSLPTMKRAVLSSVIAPDCSKSFAKCPFCSYTYTRRGLWRHIYSTHYDELLKIVDRYVSIKYRHV
jgi:hypothetical protein